MDVSQAGYYSHSKALHAKRSQQLRDPSIPPNDSVPVLFLDPSVEFSGRSTRRDLVIPVVSKTARRIKKLPGAESIFDFASD